MYTIQYSINLGSSNLWIMKHRCCTGDVFGHLVENANKILAEVRETTKSSAYSNFPSPTSPSEWCIIFLPCCAASVGYPTI